MSVSFPQSSSSSSKDLTDRDFLEQCHKECKQTIPIILQALQADPSKEYCGKIKVNANCGCFTNILVEPFQNLNWKVKVSGSIPDIFRLNVKTRELDFLEKSQDG